MHMNARFKLTPDGTVHIDNGSESYTDSLANAMADIAAAGIILPTPDLQAISGLVPVAGFEVSPIRMELILENGWHYPVPESALAQYRPYLYGITNLPAIVAAKDARLAAESDINANE